MTFALEMQMLKEVFLLPPPPSFLFLTALAKEVEITAIMANVMTVSQKSSPGQSCHPTHINSTVLAIL